MVVRGEEKRHDQEDERADHQVDARAEHIIDFTYVIGGACHGIANRLEAVEGHAFAEQGDIQFIAHIALDALGHELCPKIATQLEHPPDYLRPAHKKRQREQYFRVWRDLKHVIEGIASQYRDISGQGGVADRADEHDQHQPPVAQGVRDYPADVAAPVKGMAAGEGEFGDGHGF